MRYGKDLANFPAAAAGIDALHVSRSAGTLGEVAALPRAWLHYAQLRDGLVPGPGTPTTSACVRWTARRGAINGRFTAA